METNDKAINFYENEYKDVDREARESLEFIVLKSSFPSL